MHRLGATALALAALFTLPAGALASPPATPQDLAIMGEDVVVEAGERVHDLRAFGGDVLVRGEVTGSVAAFGGDVTVQGPVAGDVSLFGGDLVVDGTVGGNVKSAGGDVLVHGTVGGDVHSAGGDVIQSDGGKVLGRIRETVGTIEMDGLDTFVPTPPWLGDIVPGLTSLTSALFALLKLTHWAIACLVGLLFLAIDRLRFATYQESLSLSTGPSAAWGALVLVLAIALCGMCVISVVGLPFAGLLLITLGFAAHVGLALSAAAVGSFLPGRWLATRSWAQLLAGTALCFCASVVPFLGSWLMFAAVTAGLGAIVVSHRKVRPSRPVLASASALQG